MPWIKIPYYFGIVGCVSIIAWFVAMYMLVRNWRAADRTRRYWQALAFAIAGLLFAEWNTNNVVLIRQEQTLAIESAEARAERMEAQAAAEANGSTTGKVDLVVADANAQTNEVPAYRERGKVAREGGKEVGDKMLEKATEVDAHEVSVYREMSELDVSRANRYDEHNRFLAGLAYWLCLLAVLIDYLSRFNKTVGACYPLPISSRVLDDFCPKTSSVRVRRATPEAIRNFLERAVRKRETFIYFGEDNPWETPPGDDARATGVPQQSSCLPRLWIPDPRPWALETLAVGMKAIHCDRTSALDATRESLRVRDLRCVSLPILTYPSTEPDIDRQFLFESAWFSRYAVVVLDQEEASAWIDELRTFLGARLRVLAHARRTVNIVWNFKTVIPEEVLHDVLFLCGETNYKFLMMGERDLSPTVAERFEETIEVMQ